MSWSLKAALAQPAATEDALPGPSDTRVRAALSRQAEIGRPVELARVLMGYGLSLRKAHEVLNRLTRSERVHIELVAPDRDRLVADLADLGVRARLLTRPVVDVSQVRKGLGLSQAEFAVRFGLEPDTVRNWEQGRYKPDLASRVLLKVIQKFPHVVERVLETD